MRSKATFLRSALMLLALLGSSAAMAHHTFVKKYDSSKKLTLSGTVEGVRFTNPHVFFTLATAKGSWTIETESIAVANAKGLTTSQLKSGAKVSVTGWPARSGTAELGMSSISFSGGPTIAMRGTAR